MVVARYQARLDEVKRLTLHLGRLTSVGSFEVALVVLIHSPANHERLKAKVNLDAIHVLEDAR